MKSELISEFKQLQKSSTSKFNLSNPDIPFSTSDHLQVSVFNFRKTFSVLKTNITTSEIQAYLLGDLTISVFASVIFLLKSVGFYVETLDIYLGSLGKLM